MNYGRHKHKVNYGLEKLQEIREQHGDPEERKQAQKDIDAYFFGNKQKRKSKKERKRERRKKRQQMRKDYE